MNPHRTPGEVPPDAPELPAPVPFPNMTAKWTDPVWMRFFEIALGGAASRWDAAEYDTPEAYIVNRAERIADEAWRRRFVGTGGCP